MTLVARRIFAKLFPFLFLTLNGALFILEAAYCRSFFFAFSVRGWAGSCTLRRPPDSITPGPEKFLSMCAISSCLFRNVSYDWPVPIAFGPAMLLRLGFFTICWLGATAP